MLISINSTYYNKLNISCSLQEKLNKKYKLLHQIEKCNNIIKKKHKQALEICNHHLDINVQPLCRHTWEILETTAIVKNKLTNELRCVDNELENYEL